jgi:hypothetical protein
VIGKEEFAVRKQQLEAERATAHADLVAVDAEIETRGARGIDIQGSLRSITRLSDIYAELEGPAERRRLLETCLDRLIVGRGAVELRVPVQPAICLAGYSTALGTPGASHRNAHRRRRCMNCRRTQSSSAVSRPVDEAHELPADRRWCPCRVAPGSEAHPDAAALYQ